MLSYDSKTEQARKILEKTEVPYRLERVPLKNYEGKPVLCTSGGRFFGLKQIKSIFNKFS